MAPVSCGLSVGQSVDSASPGIWQPLAVRGRNLLCAHNVMRRVLLSVVRQSVDSASTGIWQPLAVRG